MTRLESKLAQNHVALTGPTRQQVLQLMMTRLESKIAQTHVALTGPTRQQVLQLMMTRLKSDTSKLTQIYLIFRALISNQYIPTIALRFVSLKIYRKSVYFFNFISKMKWVLTSLNIFNFINTQHSVKTALTLLVNIPND